MKKILLIVFSLLTLTTVHGQERSQVLKVCNWDEYIDPELIGEFEAWYRRQTGKSIKVEYEVTDYPEDQLATIESGAYDCDVFCPPEYLVERMLRRQLLMKIDTSFTARGIPNWMNGTSAFVDSTLQNIGKDSKVHMKDYCVGYLWGTTGVVFNTKYVKRSDVESWRFLFDSKFRNKIVIKDSPSDLYNILITYAKYEEIEAGRITRNALATHLSNENIALVEDLLKQARPQMKAFEVEGDKRLLANGTHRIAVTWNGDANWAVDSVSEGVSLEFIVPKEGSDVWFDCWVVPATCRNAEAAGYWINFLCKPEHALRNMDFTGYSSAVGTPEILAAVTDTLLLHPVDLSYFFGPEATAVYVDSIMYPDREIIERCSILRDCGGRQEVMREIWLRMKKMNPTDSATWYVAVGIIIIILAAIAVAVGRRKHQR